MWRSKKQWLALSRNSPFQRISPLTAGTLLPLPSPGFAIFQACLHTAASPSHHDSLSTIDSVLCSLPLLASHIHLQSLPPNLLPPHLHDLHTIGSFLNTHSAPSVTESEPELSLTTDSKTFLHDPIQNESYQSLVVRQREMEADAMDNAAKEYHQTIIDMCKKKVAPNFPFVKSLLLSWFEPFRDAILAEQLAVKNSEFSVDRINYGPYLLELPADILAVVTMHHLMGLLMKEHEYGSIRLVRAATAVGEAVEREIDIYNILKKKKKKTNLEQESAPSKSPSTGAKSMKKTIKKMLKQRQVRALRKTLEESRQSDRWDATTQAKVGTRLIELLIEVAYVQPPVSQREQGTPEVRQALRHSVKSSGAKSKARIHGVITCDPLVWKALDKCVHCAESPYMPMLIKPQAWEAYNKGAYLVLRSNLLRTHGAKSLEAAVARIDKLHLKHVFEALNTLGETPWRINKQVHDIVETIWAEGGCLAGLVDRDDMVVPPKPDTEDEVELKSWRIKAYKAKRVNSERLSQRVDTELKLSVARKYRNEERFYYPHNLDFRGRAYPMHPHLNHLGSDLCRGVLEFAEGRPLGPSGLRWLKIHLANVYANGVDKLLFDDRVAFIDENMDKIFETARHPLARDKWWLNAEDPFQFLAACFAITDAIESGDAENFICHLPVHQDGSCNGLQHYAALGRDSSGAKSVNLTKGDRPEDVYTGIATRVKQMMEMDAMKDPEKDKTAAIAQMLIGQVDRKLVKQTVMTSVYGVTYVGAKTQIFNRLEERQSHQNYSDTVSASVYAAKIVLVALGEMFKEAREIMAWLGDCAKLIASQNEEVKWTTPMGLPVVQPYRKPGWKQVKTCLQVLTLRQDNDQPVLVKRQKSAFPPNFVHSLDSAHMMMTAIACHKAGLRFAGVHDSFWTHAGDVDKMNKLLRETFVELYNQPLLENLLKSFQERLPHIVFPPLPKRGNFDINEVIDAAYFFN